MPTSVDGNSSSSHVRTWLDYRLWPILLSQSFLIVLTYYASFQLRFDFAIQRDFQLAFWRTLPILLGVKLCTLYCFGLCRGWWRYVGVSDLLDILKAAAISAALTLGSLKLVFHNVGYPRSVLGIDLALTILAIGGARFAVRLYSENVRAYFGKKSTLIVGAGEAGRKIAHELKRNPALDLNPIGFVDDDPSKRGVKLYGIRVFGNTEQLPHLIDRMKIDTVLIAIPSAKSGFVQRIVDLCRARKIELKILPPLTDRLNGSGRLTRVRRVRVEDLLGREPVALDSVHIRDRFQANVALITGAGGSIGSELARQLASFNPGRLILFERSENDLHKIAIELSTNLPHINHVPVVGDILDVRLLRDVMAEYRPNSVFHAAAYKHVPMMEINCFQAVKNNVFGTYNIALVAKQYDVQDFVLVSSDKAVNPTNIMGVTKRIAELLVLSLEHQRTRFVSVRFGNVLGSNGSVLPLFEQQIADGGPVTVTHPEARRYFMTIPEAAQLVLQASVMGKGGEIFVLDMGQPVKIVDLAQSLIRLSGLEPDRDIKIVYTGLRPGEKLFEELILQGEGMRPTPHEKIRVVDSGVPDLARLLARLEDLSALVDTKNVHNLIETLRIIVPEYTPSQDILGLCEIDRHDMTLDYRLARNSLSFAARGVA